MTPQRESKVKTVREAVATLVEDGCSLIVGGLHMHHNPMALVHEVIRQRIGIRNLITSPCGCINADILIGAGLVEELTSPYVGFEHLGMALNFRRALEAKSLKIHECDEAYIMFGLRAGASGIPFMPLPHGVQMSETVRVNRDDFRSVTDPFTGKELVAIKGIVPDVALVHCQKADRFGNAMFEGAAFADFDAIKAAKRVILMVEEIIPDEQVIANPRDVGVPSFLVDAVVEVKYGCHPTSSHTRYNYDERHLLSYLDRSRDPKLFASYLEEFVYGAPDRETYLERVGGQVALQSLRMEA